jgi:hypothetical protein
MKPIIFYPRECWIMIKTIVRIGYKTIRGVK